MAFSGFAEMFVRFAKVLCFNVPSPFFSLSQFFVVSLVVKQEYNNVSIPLSDILYVEALGNYVKIVRASGGHVLTRTNLKAITDLLPADDFLRIHRSYVVPVASVVSFTRSRVMLKGREEGLPVGTQYVTQVLEALGG